MSRRRTRKQLEFDKLDDARRIRRLEAQMEAHANALVELSGALNYGKTRDRPVWN